MFYLGVISPEDLITYESLVQEATREYRDLVNSKQWETDTIKEKYQDQPEVIEQSVNKYLNQVGFNSRRRVNGSGSGGV